MLIEFRVENHRSIKEEEVITLEAGNVEPDDDRIRVVGDKRLLPVAAIYGANASGKSNLLSALLYLRDAVALSQMWPSNGGVPRSPFAWGKEESPSLFQATFLIEGVPYEYGLVVDDEAVVEEWLKAWPLGRPQLWFERDNQSFKFGEHLKGENKSIETQTRPNALFLSAAAQLNHAQLKPIFSWFEGIGEVGVRRDGLNLGREHIRHVASMLDGENTHYLTRPSIWQNEREKLVTLARILPFLKSADLGITDARINDGRIELKHQSKQKSSWLPLDDESQGTRKMFEVAPIIVAALDFGRPVLVDEIETSLHPQIAASLVRLFQNPKSNPRNAQLIFATHDTSFLGNLMGDPLLRRDQVWLAEKDDVGVTDIFPLTDFKSRGSENLERGYLQGRYGATPFLGGDLHVGKP